MDEPPVTGADKSAEPMPVDAQPVDAALLKLATQYVVTQSLCIGRYFHASCLMVVAAAEEMVSRPKVKAPRCDLPKQSELHHRQVQTNALTFKVNEQAFRWLCRERRTDPDAVLAAVPRSAMVSVLAETILPNACTREEAAGWGVKVASVDSTVEGLRQFVSKHEEENGKWTSLKLSLTAK